VVYVRGENKIVDKQLSKDKEGQAELLTYLSEIRLIKDSFEIAEMQKAVDATNRGFADMVRVFGAASSTKRGERIIEAAFFGRARLEGNDLGYETIAASGSHACILHWIRNDGDVNDGDLILIDAGVEVDSLYTADITRTLPINGKFSPAQRKIYMLVYEAQKAGFAAVKPGAKFKDITAASHAVLAKGLEGMGVLPISAEESLKPDVGLHRRWTVHGVSHMLGIDVHDCNDARREQYADGVLEAGMILTVEPGLYIHPDDELFPAEYRGIGVRIEDDVLVTETGCRVLSNKLPSHPDEVEVWISNLSKSN
jgi:Xaa-Pro aminopeptidase